MSEPDTLLLPRWSPVPGREEVGPSALPAAPRLWLLLRFLPSFPSCELVALTIEGCTLSSPVGNSHRYAMRLCWYRSPRGAGGDAGTDRADRSAQDASCPPFLAVTDRAALRCPSWCVFPFPFPLLCPLTHRHDRLRLYIRACIS